MEMEMQPMISTHTFYEKQPTASVSTQMVGQEKDRLLIEVKTARSSARCEISPAALAAMLNAHGNAYGVLLTPPIVPQNTEAPPTHG